MAFDFPASPTAGQIFTPPGGPSFVWQSPAWRQVTTVQAIQLATAESRNRIVNPAFQISQEFGSTGATLTAYYLCDQWLGQNSAIANYFVRFSGFTSPLGSKNRALVDIGTNVIASPAATAIMGFEQLIEGVRIADFGWGSSAAKQVVLRFGVRSQVAGTFGGSLVNGAGLRSYVFSYTIAAGEVNTDVYRTIVIPGDQLGTWLTDTGIGINLWFTFMAGSGYQGAAGSWTNTARYGPTGMTNGCAVASKQFSIFDVGLYRDPSNTGLAPVWQEPDYAVELLACQRYWQQYPALLNSMGYSAATQNNHYALPFSPAMRTSPALTFSGITANNCTGPNAYMQGPNQIAWYTTTTAAGYSYTIHTVTLNARM